jgi:UDP-N-acetylmuramoyl-tripeptide--D-alanyl-D-alanine ligase
MTSLWTSAEIETLLGMASTAPWSCSGISIDSRTLEKGDLFIPLQGESGDGHAFLNAAAQKEASAAFTSQAWMGDLPSLSVPDTLHALEQLGIAARTRCPALRLAVTGSVGKTSTKDMLTWVFKDQGLTHSSVSSYNNQWGVPLTLARMPKNTQFSIFEMGMNHTGEMRTLTHMVKPQISLITTIAAAHTAFFSSLEEIARAKAEIFEGMERGSPVVLNQDNSQFFLLSQMAKDQGLSVFSFGEKGDFHLLSYTLHPAHSTVKANIGGKEVSYTLPVPGKHWVINSLGVLGVVSLAGADVEKAAHSLATASAPPGRGRCLPGIFTILDESYNANPTSMRAALAVLGKSEGKRRIAVIGDMRELGDEARRYHEELLEPLVEHNIDLVYCCGPFMAHLFERLPFAMQGAYAPTSLELIPLLKKDILPGDTISVKGSLGTRMKPIVEALMEEQKRLD